MTGLFLRVWKIAEIPPGLWFDEAINGLDALSLIHDNHFRIFFQFEDFPREPFYIYCAAPFIWFFGNEAWALRLTSVAIGTLTLPLAYLFAREWFDRRTALMLLLCLVFLRWHIHFSRTGFRTIATPPFMLLGFWLLHRGIRLGGMRNYILSGVFFGAGFYTYLSFRLVPFVFLIWLAAFLIQKKGELPDHFRRGITWTIVAGFLALLPLLGHYVQVPYHFTGRTSMITIGPREAVQNAAKVALMFSVVGDPEAKHNTPERVVYKEHSSEVKVPVPVFDALSSIFFYLGLIFTIVAARRSHAMVLILAWFLVMSLNSVLSAGAPNLLRTVAMVPAVALILANGYLLLLRWKPIRKTGPWILALCCCAYCASNVWQYYVVFPSSAIVWTRFNTSYYEIARQTRGLSRSYDVYLPRNILNHTTVRYITYGCNGIYPLEIPDTLARETFDPAVNRNRMVLVTPESKLYQHVEELCPNLKLVHLFNSPFDQRYGYILILPVTELKPGKEIDDYFKGKIDVIVFPDR